MKPHKARYKRNHVRHIKKGRDVRSKTLNSDSSLPPLQKKVVVCFIGGGSLRVIKDVFYFTLKVFFVFKMFNFLSLFFGHVDKMAWLERNGYFNIGKQLRNNCNIHIA